MSNTIISPPKHIKGEARQEWQRIISELQSAGRLDETDRAIITLYVETWSIWRKAITEVNEHGSVIVFANDNPGQSPHYKVMKDCGAKLRGLLKDLGLTPASRGKSEAPAPADLEF